MKKTYCLPAIGLLFVGLLFFSDGNAQKKNFTYDEAFASRGGMFSSSMPRLTGWFDDAYYLESKREEGNQVVMKVSAATGESEV